MKLEKRIIKDLNSICEKCNNELDEFGEINLQALTKELIYQGFFTSVTDIAMYILSNLENEVEFPIEFIPIEEEIEYLTDEYIKRMN